MTRGRVAANHLNKVVYDKLIIGRIDKATSKSKHVRWQYKCEKCGYVGDAEWKPIQTNKARCNCNTKYMIWTPAQIEYLKENFAEKGVGCAEELKMTQAVVKYKANMLGLKKEHYGPRRKT